VNSIRRKHLFLCVVSVIFSLLVAEVLSRWLLPKPFRASHGAHFMRPWHQPDPVIGWILTPESIKVPHRVLDSQGLVEFDVVYSLAGGQRITSAHPPNAPAIIATGCSFTFGHGLNDEDTWPWLLQKKFPNYRVMNLGVMGYGTDQALLAAERQVLRSPQQTAAVVLGLADFQIERNRSPQGWLAYIPYAKPLFVTTPGGAMYKRSVRFWSPGPLAEQSGLIAHFANTMANRVYGITSHDEARALTVALITTFAHRFQALGVPLVVVWLPHAGDTAPQSRSDKDFLIEHLRAASIPILVPDIPRLGNGQIDMHTYAVSTSDWHPNRQYNLIVADQLYRFLLESLQDRITAH